MLVMYECKYYFIAVCIIKMILVFPFRRDLRMHKSVLAEDLLPDGTALQYVMHGKVNVYYYYQSFSPAFFLNSPELVMGTGHWKGSPWFLELI